MNSKPTKENGARGHAIIALMPSLFLYGGAAVMAAASTSSVSLLGGTFYSVALSKDFAAIAIDSRSRNAMNPSAAPDDRYCKLHPLSDSLIFFATGTAASYRTQGTKIFDVADEARRAFANTPLTDLDLIAEKWSASMQAAYATMFTLHPDLKARFDAKILAAGYFVGADLQGKIVSTKFTIGFYVASGITVSRDRKEISTDDIAFVTSAEHVEITTELVAGKSQRSQSALAELEAQTANLSGVEISASRVGLIVRAVRDWANDPDVGGEIAVLILERGRKWRWFRRPDFCPKN